MLLAAAAVPVAAQQVTVLCNFEVDWCEGLLEAHKSPRAAELHDWAQRISEENNYFQTPIYTGVLDWGYNTELHAKKKLPEPKYWADLTNPAYKDESQKANPGTSGTAFNKVSTILQLMGEDAGFKFLATMDKNQSFAGEESRVTLLSLQSYAGEKSRV